MLNHLLTQAADTPPAALALDADTLIAVLTTLLAVGLVLRYLRVILTALAIVMLSIVVVGIVEIAPYLTQVVDSMRSVTS